MTIKLKEDRTALVETLSAITLFAIALSLTKENTVNAFDIHLYFWAVSLTILSVLQLISIYTNMIVLRLVMAWVAGIVWTWFAFTSLNTIVYIPSLAIGAVNIYAFILLTNRIHFDWLEFLKE